VTEGTVFAGASGPAVLDVPSLNIGTGQVMETEPALQRALSRKRELEAELRKVENFLELYQQFAGDTSAGKNVVQNEGGVIEDTKQSSFHTPYKYNASRAPRMSQEEFEQLARKILLEAGRPLVRETILEKLHDLGRRLGDTDDKELGTLKTKLWRAKGSIVPIAGSGYWLADVPCEPVSYDPGQAGSEK
jgi:hypothetical protein